MCECEQECPVCGDGEDHCDCQCCAYCGTLAEEVDHIGRCDDCVEDDRTSDYDDICGPDRVEAMAELESGR